MSKMTPASMVQKLFDKSNRLAKNLETPEQERELVSRYADLLTCMAQGYLTAEDPRWLILNQKLTADQRGALKKNAWDLYRKDLTKTLYRAVDTAREALSHEPVTPDYGRPRIEETKSLSQKILKIYPSEAQQSVIHTENPHILQLPCLKLAAAGMKLVQNPQTVLIIGLGAGSLVHHLRHYYPYSRITAVEINPEVVDLAITDFGVDARMVHQYDGAEFLEKTQDLYDVIFLDAFSPTDEIPDSMATKEFLESALGSLTEDGVLIANLWGSSPDYPYMRDLYAEVFPETHAVRAVPDNNRVIFAFKRERNYDRLSLSHLMCGSKSLIPLPPHSFSNQRDLICEGYLPYRKLSK